MEQSQSNRTDTMSQDYRAMKITESQDCGSPRKITDYTAFLGGVPVVPCRLRQLGVHMSEGTINLSKGLPNPASFPYSRIDVTMRDGSVLSLTDDKLDAALQYGTGYGVRGLTEWLYTFQRLVHDPPPMRDDDGFGLHITSGCTEAVQKCLDILVGAGDSIVVQQFSYSTVLSSLQSRRVQLLGVEEDCDGMLPCQLRAVLATAAPKPRLLYLVPTGANPSATTFSMHRKQQIYQIAREHDMMILEDDPYYFLTYQEERIGSLQSLDVDGRVVRCDSFSKVLCPGMRMGYVSGAKAIVDALAAHLTSRSHSTFPLGQYILLETLTHYGHEGFLQYLQQLPAFYRVRRDAMSEALQEYMTELAEWEVPSSGMFFWVKLRGGGGGSGMIDSTHLFFHHALPAKVLFVPGEYFLPTPAPSPYIRLSFSFAEPQQIRQGIQRLASLLTTLHQ